MKQRYYILPFLIVGVFISCNETKKPKQTVDSEVVTIHEEDVLLKFSKSEGMLSSGESIALLIDIPVTGRYEVKVHATATDSLASLWLEDYVDNTDDRTYNVTGELNFDSNTESAQITGSPFTAGKHHMKLNNAFGAVQVNSITITLIKPYIKTPKTFIQNMEGEKWQLVWSDEFDGFGLPDSSKWEYNMGNWGWGNNELQYYTEKKLTNARLENGNLIIEARKNEAGKGWTSARLTSQGKEAFLYGKMEFRAKVPVGRGTWAAGWFLGDDYIDELSWPYCGEIDVLECVGFEINDTTGNGINHATCHTRKYYFKQGNQIGSDIEVRNMQNEFHTYSIEWYPNEIKAFLDGVHYYTYDKNADELEWPFDKPQNFVINLAIGGGWGGAKGIDSSYTNHQYILDYVRVYERVQE